MSEVATPRKVFLASYGFWQFGEGYQTILFTWLLTNHLLFAPEKIGFYQSLFLLPSLVFMFLGGILSDRFGPQRVAVTAKLLFACATSLFCYSLYVGRVSDEVLLIYAVTSGILSALGGPAIDYFIPIVADGEIKRMTIMSSAIHYSGKFVGSLLILIVGMIGVVAAFAIHALSMFVAGLLILLLVKLLSARDLLGSDSTASSSSGEGKFRDQDDSRSVSFLGSFGELWMIFGERPALRVSVLTQIGLGLFNIPLYFVVMPVALRDYFGAPQTSLGYMSFAYWCGSILVSVFAMTSGGVFRLSAMKLLTLALLMDAVAIGTIAVARDYNMALVLFFIHGGATGLILAMSHTLLLENAPNSHRTRLLSLYQIGLWGFAPVGISMAGLWITNVGVQSSLAAAAVGVVVLALFSYYWERHSQ